jgi:hypothetical protein
VRQWLRPRRCCIQFTTSFSFLFDYCYHLILYACDVLDDYNLLSILVPRPWPLAKPSSFKKDSQAVSFWGLAFEFFS